MCARLGAIQGEAAVLHGLMGFEVWKGRVGKMDRTRNLECTVPSDQTSGFASERDYLEAAHAVLARIENRLDAWLDADELDTDARRTGGLLEISLPDRSQLIVNLQPPLQEIWLAARAGGHHFHWVGGDWLDTKTGQRFWTVLDAALRAQTGSGLSFDS